MRLAELKDYRHPRTHEVLSMQPGGAEAEDGEIRSGSVTAAGDVYEIVDGIPRFCPKANYAANFGYQWHLFPTLQLDSKARWACWDRSSEDRLFGTTRWAKHLHGQRVLEAGSGMGRFTEILARTGAEVFTFDYSTAVEESRSNNHRYSNVRFAQADIYQAPYEPASFDKVLCLGVLQHCPSPREAFASLVRLLKPGGEIAVDVYALNWRSPLYGKYYLRPVTKRLPARHLQAFARFQVGWVFPLTHWLYPRIGRVAAGLSWLRGVADYHGHVEADKETLRDFALLDTIDALSPAYDRPQTVGSLRSWCAQSQLQDVEIVREGVVGIQIVLRARKPRL